MSLPRLIAPSLQEETFRANRVQYAVKNQTFKVSMGGYAGKIASPLLTVEALNIIITTRYDMLGILIQFKS